MLERAITPELSSRIVDLLVKERGWTLARIARRIKAARDYIVRVQKGRQQFEYADVEALARACHQKTHLFIFAAMQPAKMTTEQRELYQLTQNLIASHEQFVKAIARKPMKKRRSRAKAA